VDYIPRIAKERRREVRKGAPAKALKVNRTERSNLRVKAGISVFGPEGPPDKGGSMAEGYCVKCKEKREMKEPEEVVMKNKMKALKGTCPKCGTKIFKITGKA
jgi:hypothetical protein